MGSINLKSVTVATLRQRFSDTRSFYSSMKSIRRVGVIGKSGVALSLLALLALPFVLTGSSSKSNAEIAASTENSSVPRVDQPSSDTKTEAGVVVQDNSSKSSNDQSGQSLGYQTPTSSSSSSISIKSNSITSGSSTTNSTETVVNNNGNEQSHSTTTTNESGNSKVNLNVGENTEVEIHRRGDKVRIDFSERTRTEN